ncbi:MAG: hypothetical protein OIF50_12865 [Flavobacteriaceae bacterium]|nr:hypothetical protein [Flavobacteriaceae bacterium]
MKQLFIFSLLILGLVFLQSCQNEELDIIDNTETENITPDSEAANLMMRTVSNDGSFDNIIDGASCISIVYPVTVTANGIGITIESEKGLKLIENVFDALDTDEDILEISFPIMVEMPNYETIVIADKAALVELAKQCIENGDDNDIECVDFVYPITFDKLNLQGVKTSQVQVNSDKEMRKLLDQLNDKELVSIQYPIQLKTSTGEVIDVQNNAQLVATIDQNKGLCDEDDDNDYNDDDFDSGHLESFLKDCDFKVVKVIRNEQDSSVQYKSWEVEFDSENRLKIENEGGTVMTGTWYLVKNGYDLVLKTQVEDAPDFSGEWKVCELSEGKIKLYIDDANKIFLNTYCDDDTSENKSVKEQMMDCKWLIKNVENNGTAQDTLIGYQLQFAEEDVVAVYRGNSLVGYGEWSLSKEGETWYVDLREFSNMTALNMKLPVYEIKTKRLKLYNGNGSQLKLEKFCADGPIDEDVAEITDVLMSAEWQVSKFEQNGDPMEGYSADIFEFTEDMELGVKDANGTLLSSGFWKVYRNSYGVLEMMINFDLTSNYFPLVNDWKIAEKKDDEIVLKHDNGNDQYDYLTFRKID